MPREIVRCLQCDLEMQFDGTQTWDCPNCGWHVKEEKRWEYTETFYTETELKEAVQANNEACLKILREEQEEFAEDRDKRCLDYSISAISKRGE